MKDDLAVFKDEKSLEEKENDFDDFWCINVNNLKERNLAVLADVQAKFNKSRTPSVSRRKKPLQFA